MGALEAEGNLVNSRAIKSDRPSCSNVQVGSRNAAIADDLPGTRLVSRLQDGQGAYHGRVGAMVALRWP